MQHNIHKHTVSINWVPSLCTSSETDLQRHLCHQQNPEYQANLCLPSHQAHLGVQSDQSDLDDPEADRRKPVTIRK